jgi:hypothetical protein
MSYSDPFAPSGPASVATRDLNREVCRQNWELNAAQYRELGLPVPPNDCEFRTWGFCYTFPLPSHGYLPNVTPEVLAWRQANPGGGVENPWDEKSRRILEENNLCPDN